MSDFAGLRLAATALQAQQRGVEVAAQNVADANTEGYSRQRVDLESLGAPDVAASWSRYEGAGSGVKFASSTRPTPRCKGW
jgi:flagellar hook-associated protein 1 FlgK